MTVVQVFPWCYRFPANMTPTHRRIVCNSFRRQNVHACCLAPGLFCRRVLSSCFTGKRPSSGKMLSVATATVHRSMRPKTPSPNSSPSTIATVGNVRSWNSDHTPSSKRRKTRQGPCSARKKILPNPVEEVSHNFGINNPDITVTIVPRKESITHWLDSAQRKNSETVDKEKHKSDEGVLFTDCNELTILSIPRNSTGKTQDCAESGNVSKHVAVVSPTGINENESGSIPSKPKVPLSIHQKDSNETETKINGMQDKPSGSFWQTWLAQKSDKSKGPAVITVPIENGADQALYSCEALGNDLSPDQHKLRSFECMSSKLLRATAYLNTAKEQSDCSEINAKKQEEGEGFTSTRNKNDIQDIALTISDPAEDDSAIFSNSGIVENWDDDNIETSVSNVSLDLYKSKDLQAKSNLETPYYMTGFPNPPGENRCWLNATLQTLFALPFMESFQDRKFNDLSELTKMFLRMPTFWKKGSLEKQKMYQTIKSFKNELLVLDESYASDRQQDVSEFLMIFLNHVKAEYDKFLETDSVGENTENIPENQQDSRRLLKAAQTPSKRQPLTDISLTERRSNQSSDDHCSSPTTRRPTITYGVQDLLSPKINRMSNPVDPSYKIHTPPQNHVECENEAPMLTNPIDEYFLLHMMEHYTCKGCSKYRQKKVDNLMLYVDVPACDFSVVSLNAAVKKCLATEERSLTCSNCKDTVHNMRTTFRRPPRILMVQVNRYGMASDGSCAKISTTVEISETLELESSLMSNPSEGPQTYEPTCIISHVGGTIHCGHYTAYVYRHEKWLHYNDMSVTTMTKREVLTDAKNTAYLIFFVNSTIMKHSQENSRS